MKWNRIIFFVSCLFSLSLCAADDGLVDVPMKEQCPYGHKTIKQIPISYGLGAGMSELGKPKAERTSVSGGCVILSGKSPRAISFCTTCEAEYWPQLDWINPKKDIGRWKCQSTDAEVFGEFYVEQLQSLSLLFDEKVNEPRVFWDSYDGDGGDRSMMVEYVTSIAMDALVKQIDHYYTTCSLEVRKTVRHQDSIGTIYTWKVEDHADLTATARLLNDKTILVSLTFYHVKPPEKSADTFERFGLKPFTADTDAR